MGYQFNFICDNVEVLNVDTVNLERRIKKMIRLSDSVFVYRSHNHLSQKNDFINWLYSSDDFDSTDSIKIDIPEYDAHEIINSLSPFEPIRYYKINDQDTFISRFKISIRDFKNIVNNEITNSDFFIDDPLYDQYDFVFTKNKELVMWTDLHVMHFNINKSLV